MNAVDILKLVNKQFSKPLLASPIQHGKPQVHAAYGQ